LGVFLGLIIVNATYLFVAFLINEKNAKYLLSGYNMMSEKEREKIDLHKYLKFFKSFFIGLMISSSIIYSVLYFISDIKTAGIGYLAFKGIMFFYFIVKGYSFKVK
jgi:hypothetical protein